MRIKFRLTPWKICERESKREKNIQPYDYFFSYLFLFQINRECVRQIKQLESRLLRRPNLQQQAPLAIDQDERDDLAAAMSDDPDDTDAAAAYNVL